MSRPYTSRELFHLVGRSHPADHEANYQTLLKILDSGCVSHPPHDPNSYMHRVACNLEGNIFSEELIVPSVTCFCDIPYDALGIHIQKYGAFGLSFPREFLIRYGARPVIYFPMQPSDPNRGWGTIFCEMLLTDLEQIWRGFREQLVDPIGANSWSRSLGEKPKTQNDAIKAMDDAFTQQFLAFIKPFNSELPDNDPNNFYLEREWRRFANLRFQPSDFSHILSERTYVDRLKSERPMYANKILPAP